MVFGDNTSKVDTNNQIAVFEHLLNEIDEIKRYVAATYSSVDTEIKDLHKMMHHLEKQLQETDGQINRIERFEISIKNIEKSVHNIERKLPR